MLQVILVCGAVCVGNALFFGNALLLYGLGNLDLKFIVKWGMLIHFEAYLCFKLFYYALCGAFWAFMC